MSKLFEAIWLLALLGATSQVLWGEGQDRVTGAVVLAGLFAIGVIWDALTRAARRRQERRAEQARGGFVVIVRRGRRR